jgi:hypothetical protein
LIEVQNTVGESVRGSGRRGSGSISPNTTPLCEFLLDLMDYWDADPELEFALGKAFEG